AVDLAHLAGREDPHPALPLERTRLVDRRLERAEVVAPVHEPDRMLGRVLQPERPVERRVAAADDHAGAVAEDLLLAHEVVHAAALPVLDPLDPELARLERAVARGDDQRTGQVRAALVGADREQLLAVLAQALERLHLLAEVDVRLILQPLLGAELDELRALDLRMAGDVVHVLLRVDGRYLSAELLQALDDPNRGVAVTGVVRGGKARGTRSENRDVGDAASAQGATSLVRTAGAAARSALGRLALFHLEGVAAAARAGDVRVVDREAGLQALDPVDLGAGQVGRAERVDDHRHAVARELVVPVLGAAVEAERVLEAGAAAALNRDAEHLRLAGGLLGHQALDLRRRALGERDDLEGLLGGRHRAHRSNGLRRSESPSRASGNPELVTAATGVVEPFSSPLVATLDSATFLLARPRGGCACLTAGCPS